MFSDNIERTNFRNLCCFHYTFLRVEFRCVHCTWTCYPLHCYGDELKSFSI